MQMWTTEGITQMVYIAAFPSVGNPYQGPGGVQVIVCLPSLQEAPDMRAPAPHKPGHDGTQL